MGVSSVLAGATRNRSLRVRRVVRVLAIAWSVPGVWGAGPGVAAASRKDPVRINFACASREVFAGSGIQAVAREMVSRHGGGDVHAWGDRAVAIDLNHDGRPEYLVPVSCGARCSCTWAIIATNPARALGIVQGCVVDLSVARRGWAAVTGYTHLPASEGALTTYAYKDGEYRKQVVATLTPLVAESYERCKDKKDCCP